MLGFKILKRLLTGRTARPEGAGPAPGPADAFLPFVEKGVHRDIAYLGEKLVRDFGFSEGRSGLDPFDQPFAEWAAKKGDRTITVRFERERDDVAVSMIADSEAADGRPASKAVVGFLGLAEFSRTLSLLNASPAHEQLFSRIWDHVVGSMAVAVDGAPQPTRLRGGVLDDYARELSNRPLHRLVR